MAILLLAGDQLSARTVQSLIIQPQLEEEFLIRLWNPDSGLPQDSARSLAMTKDGYVWIGTFNGLSRIDGTVPAERFSVRKLAGAKTDGCISMFGDSKGNLWIGMANEIARYSSDRTWAKFSPPAASSSWDMVMSFAERPDGTVHFGSEKGVYRIVDGNVESLRLPDKPKNDNGAWHIVFDEEGTLWTRTDRLIARYYKGQWTNVMVLAESDVATFNGIKPAKKGGVWISKVDKLLHYQKGQVVSQQNYPEDFHDPLVAILEDSKENIWIGGFENGLVIFLNNGLIQRSLLHEGLIHTHLTSLLEDREGNIFIGTGVAGAMQLTPKRFKVYHGDGLASRESEIVSLTARHQSGVVFANAAGEVFVLTNEIPKRIVSRNEQLQIQSVICTADDDIWIGTDKRGLFRVGDSHVEPLFPLQLSGKVISTLTRDFQNRIWIGTDQEIASYDPQTKIFQSTLLRDVTDFFGVTTIGHMLSGQVFFSSDDLLFRLKDGKVETVTIAGVNPARTIVAMAGDPEGGLWISLRAGGLVWIQPDGKQFLFDERHGVPTLAIGSLVLDDQDTLWGGSFGGIYSLSLPCLKDVASGKLKSCEKLFFNHHDGLLQDNSRPTGRPGSGRSSDGRIWFATSRGAAVTDPRSIKPYAPCQPPLIREVEIEGERVPIRDGKVVLNPGSRHARVHFTLPSLSVPERVRFEYRLVGLNDQWVVGSGSRFADVGRLEPKTYRFEVRGYNSDRQLSTDIAALAIRVEPFYWETPWFHYGGIALILAACIGTGILIHRDRLQRAESALAKEQTIAQERARSAAVIEATTDLVLFADRDQKILYMNRAGRELLGIPLDENLSSTPTEYLVPIQSRDEWKQRLLSLKHSGQNWAAEMQLLSRRGNEVAVSAVVLVHQDRFGQTDFYSVVCQDISRRKLDEEVRAHLDKQLRQSHKMEALGTLAGGIAHDFNNILAAISGNTQLALAELSTEHPAQLSLAEVRKASQRAASLVSQILTFSRQQESQPEWIQIQPIAMEALNLLRISIPTTIQLQTHFLRNSPWISADPTQIHQVIVNLGTNAAQAIGNRPGSISFEESVITVDQTPKTNRPQLKPGRYVCLKVRDTGVGMSREVMDRIFDPFFTTKGPNQGTGLGLSVVHGIMEKVHGAITVDSQVGVGSVFVLYFPASESVELAPPPPVAPSPRGNGEEVLLVDDEEPIIFLSSRVLKKLGYRPASFTNPEEALAEFERRPHDFGAVISDISMPIMPGPVLVKRLLEIRPDLAVILTTGFARPEDQKSAEELKVHALLLKPTSIEELGKALASALAERRMTQSV